MTPNLLLLYCWLAPLRNLAGAVFLRLSGFEFLPASTQGFFAAWLADWRTWSGVFLGIGLALFAWIAVECVRDWQARAPLREAQKAAVAEAEATR